MRLMDENPEKELLEVFIDGYAYRASLRNRECSSGV